MGNPSATTTSPTSPTGSPGPSTDPSTDGTETGCNLAVLLGRCSAGVEVRTFESGRRLASLAIRTPASAPPRRRGGTAAPRATSVPVTVWDPPAWLDGVEAGDALIVVGTVRRRFFATRTGGRGAKAEVEAVTVARASRAQLDRAWQRATGALDVLT
jgi:single-stranded DNA-binding protein